MNLISYNRKNEKYTYASAPYNFIPFPEEVIYRHENPPYHYKFEKNLKTGYIEYNIDVETPIFISNGDKDFFNVNKKYMVPGSTVRGKIRSTAEILSYSYPEFVENNRLWYRGAFASDVLKDMYQKVIKPDKDSNINDHVKAGYLIRENNEYKIIAAKEYNEKSFKLIHEKNLKKSYDYMLKVNPNKKDCNNIIKFMYELKIRGEGDSWEKIFNLKKQKKTLNKKLRELNKKKPLLKEDESKKTNLKKEIKNLQDNINNILSKNKTTDKYTGYYCKIKYSQNKNHINIKDIKRTVDDDSYCYLMNSSNLNNKQNHYIIYPQNRNMKKIDITKELINQYKTNVKHRPMELDEKFDIDKKFNEKPIFYILDNDKNLIAFGFTPYLKIAYDESISTGINTKKDENNTKLDYINSIFGYTNKNIEGKNSSYKGRVSFTNAELIKDCGFEKTVSKALINPKKSSFQLYIQQPEISKFERKKLKTYSGKFKLRGQKFYWLRNDSDLSNSSMKNISTQVKSIKAESKFRGRIYFENLYEDELGLILMSIKAFEEAKDNLGQGKSYGFGRVEFNITDIKEIDIGTRFKNLNIQYKKDTGALENKINLYKENFKDRMKKEGINFDFFNEDRLKCFYASRHQIRDIKDAEFNYMDLKRFKNREVLKPMVEYAKEVEYTDTVSVLAKKFKVRRK